MSPGIEAAEDDELDRRVLSTGWATGLAGVLLSTAVLSTTTADSWRAGMRERNLKAGNCAIFAGWFFWGWFLL